MSRESRKKRQTAQDQPPPAPWGRLPLVELAVLVALALLVAGFFSSGTRAVVLIGAGILIGSAAGLEQAIREHLAGYRSHTLVLAGLPAVATLAALFALAPEALSPAARLVTGALVFVLGAWAMTALFRRRSGGLSFRITGFRK